MRFYGYMYRGHLKSHHYMVTYGSNDKNLPIMENHPSPKIMRNLLWENPALYPWNNGDTISVFAIQCQNNIYADPNFG